ncbi:hypothetical protein WK80_14455 [Burkholderia multivorans]|nr:hypothetical protein WK80_14455 [Burkholderia multivorans]KWA37443.1 hypothetical protein WL27_17405 [Burkholderia multivorans]
MNEQVSQCFFARCIDDEFRIKQVDLKYVCRQRSEICTRSATLQFVSQSCRLVVKNMIHPKTVTTDILREENVVVDKYEFPSSSTGAGLDQALREITTNGSAANQHDALAGKCLLLWNVALGDIRIVHSQAIQRDDLARVDNFKRRWASLLFSRLAVIHHDEGVLELRRFDYA